MIIAKLLVPIASLLMVFGCAAAARAGEHVVLRTDFPPFAAHAGLYLAAQKGWFKAAGLDVEIQDGRGSNDTIALVGAGKVDVGFVSLEPLMSAREAGVPVKAFSGVTNKSDLGLIYDPTQFTTIKGVEGHTVAIFAASSWTPFIRPFFEAAGVDPNAVKLTYVDVTAMLPSYLNKTVDAALSTPPNWLPQAEGVRPSKAFYATDYGLTIMGYGLVASDEELAKRAPMLSKVAAVIAKSYAYIYDGHEQEAIDAMVKARPDAKLKPNLELEKLKIYRNYFSPVVAGHSAAYQSRAQWAAAIATLQKAGQLKKGHKPNEYFTNTLVTELK